MRAQVVVCIVALFVTSCSVSVKTKVNTFRNDSLPLGAGTIAVVAMGGKDVSGLEFGFYKKRLEERLISVGYQIVGPQEADYRALLGYEVERIEEKELHQSLVVGAAYGYHPRALIFNEKEHSKPTFNRSVIIHIVKMESAGEQNVVEIKALSAGRCESLSVVYDAMLEAIFRNIARPDGSLETISVPSSSSC